MPATDLQYTLNESDKNLLKEMLLWFEKDRINTSNRFRVEEPDVQAPEVYIALSPIGGIPALASGPNTSGTYLDTSGPSNMPVATVCQIWKLNQATGDMVYAGFSKPVYNLSLNAWPAYQWVPIKRDKFGQWYADQYAQVTSLPSVSSDTISCTVSNGLDIILTPSVGECVCLIQAYARINSLGVSDQLELSCQWNDESSNGITHYLIPLLVLGGTVGTTPVLNAVGNYVFPDFTIRSFPSDNILLKSVWNGAGHINYDVGGSITQLR